MSEIKKKKKVKKKNRKLSFQLGIISLAFFLVTLCLLVPLFYMINRSAYLKSKEECFDLDLLSIRNEIVRPTRRTSWLFSLMREFPEDFRRPLTDKENEVRSTKEYWDELVVFFQDESVDPETLSFTKQLLFAREMLQRIEEEIGARQATINADIFVLDVYQTDEVFVYLHDAPGKNDNDDTSMLPLSGEEHGVLKELRSADRTDPDKTYYEMTESNGIAYYIGYLPIYFKDGSACTVCIMYDWSSYRSLTFQRLVVFIAGIIVLLILYIILLILIYGKAVKPVEKIKEGVEEYKDNKNAEMVTDKMEQIQSGNELGVLADSFADMVTEVDRYYRENQKLNIEQERINSELSLARNIQSSMLPTVFPAFPGRKDFELYASMTPARDVGGDFYDFFMIDDDHLCLMIADVSGKGIPAALFMMASKITLKNQALQGKSPAGIVTGANRLISANNPEMFFVTVWLGVLELSTGKLTAVNAGHEPLAIMGEDGKFRLYEEEHSLFVGIKEDMEYGEYELTLKPGSSLFIYTDGVTEATSARDELFGADRMIEALNAAAHASPEKIIHSVHQAVDAFVQEAEQNDDLAMLCFVYHGPDAE